MASQVEPGCIVCIAANRAELAYPGDARTAAELGALGALAVALAFSSAHLVSCLCRVHMMELDKLRTHGAKT